MSGRHFYAIGTAFTGGIFFRSFFDFGFPGVGLVVVVATAFFIAWWVQSRDRTSPLFLLCITCLSFGVGMLRLEVSESHVSPLRELEGKQVLLTARVIREPEDRAMSTHLYVEPQNEPAYADERILVLTDRFLSTQSNVSYGDVILVEGTLVRPKAFESDGGREFDYPGYLKARGVEYTIPFAEVTIISKEEGTLLKYLFAGKRTFQDTLERFIPEPYAGLGEGILLGVKRAIGEPLEQTFRETGIIHIVVLSGYNIMIVVEFVMFLLSFWFFPRTRMVLGISAIVVFAILVGLSATVVRASAMAALLLIARTTGHTYAVLRALMLAGTIMLLMNPYLLVHDPGFQLSFLATLGLILLSPPIEKRLMRVPNIVGVRTFLTATLATQIIVLPLLLYHMGLFSVVSVFVNVLVLPMVPIAMLLTFLTGVTGLLSSAVGLGVGYLAHLSLKYIIVVAEMFGALPFASVSVSVFPFWVVIVAYLILVLCIWKISRTQQSEKASEVIDAYADWVIEEEQHGSPEALRASGEQKDPLPFR